MQGFPCILRSFCCAVHKFFRTSNNIRHVKRLVSHMHGRGGNAVKNGYICIKRLQGRKDTSRHGESTQGCTSRYTKMIEQPKSINQPTDLTIKPSTRKKTVPHVTVLEPDVYGVYRRVPRHFPRLPNHRHPCRRLLRHRQRILRHPHRVHVRYLILRFIREM